MSSLLLALTLFAAPVNLVPNANFAADPTGWNLPRQVTLDTTVGHGDQRSLKFHNADAAAYPMATYPLPLVPGRLYRFSVWVRTQGVTGEESGATTCIEFDGPKGWLGGAYPSGRKGDADWFQVVGDITLPDEATASHLTLYLRKGCTGTAWFDDVEVIEVLPPPLSAYLERPNYRGRVPAGTDLPDAVVRVRVGRNLAGDRTPADTQLKLSLAVADRNLRTVDLVPTGPKVTMKLPLGKLDKGYHELRLRLLAKNDGSQLAAWDAPLNVYDPKDPPLAVDIDDDGYCRVAGKRFFPLGLYLGGVKPEDLARIAAGGFNTIMPYGSTDGGDAGVKARLDAVAAARLKIIFSIKDLYHGTEWSPKEITAPAEADARAEHYVTTFRDHPALLAWYLNDELPVAMHDTLAARYRRVATLDPSHPTWSVLYQVNQMEQYVDTADVLGSDPYPIPDAPAAMAGQWTTLTAAAKGPWGPIWQVPQAHDWSVYKKDAKPHPPTLQEERTMTYQRLAAGAQGLIFYSWFDLQRDPGGFAPRWQDLCIVADEVNNLMPWLLSTEPAPDLKLAPSNLKTVYARTWQREGQTLVIAANGADQPGRVGWTLPAGRTVRRLSGQATWTGEAVELPTNGAVALLVEGK
ncbi:MAG: hypothetical protein HZB16_20160 [Armatimonadetes bacterium]|nr:hypothetical protein [Armatimonadota bacterium]